LNDKLESYYKDEICQNDDSIGDIEGYTCSDGYDAYIEECGNWDTEDFKAANFCCVCGGGSII
jgi:hypothetical protein